MRWYINKLDFIAGFIEENYIFNYCKKIPKKDELSISSANLSEENRIRLIFLAQFIPILEQRYTHNDP